MQESIAFLVRVQCRRKESSRSLSHLLMSFLLSLQAAVSVPSEPCSSSSVTLCWCLLFVLTYLSHVYDMI